jgi:hypothetical protein
MIFRDLPDWDDKRPSRFPDDEEGDEWKSKETTEACKAMYAQWQQVVYLLNGVLPQDEDEQQSDEAGYRAMVAVQIWGDIHLAAVTMLSSEVVHYVGKMEHAAIIRKCAKDVALALWSLKNYDKAEAGLDEGHRKVICAEIDKFRALYKEWIATFRKDEYEDEWGLFV